MPDLITFSIYKKFWNITITNDGIIVVTRDIDIWIHYEEEKN